MTARTITLSREAQWMAVVALKTCLIEREAELAALRSQKFPNVELDEYLTHHVARTNEAIAELNTIGVPA